MLTDTLQIIHYHRYSDEGFFAKLSHIKVGFEFNVSDFKELLQALGKLLNASKGLYDNKIMYTIIDMYAILQAKRYEFLMYNIELNISSDEYEDYFQEFQEVVFSEIYDQEDTRKYKALKREDLNFQRFI